MKTKTSWVKYFTPKLKITFAALTHYTMFSCKTNVARVGVFRQLLAFMLIFNLISVLQCQTIEYFSEDSSTITEVGRRYSLYRNSKLNLYSKVISNFETLFKPFNPCLIHIINYDGLNIVFDKIPIILSRYDVIQYFYKIESTLLHSVRKPIYSNRKRLLMYENIFRNLSAISWCKRHRLDMECIDIPFIDKSSSSRQWFCEVHFYLFPPTDSNFYDVMNEKGEIKLLIPGNYKRLFWTLNPGNIEIRDGYTEDVLLVNRPRYDVLVNVDDQQKLECWLNAISRQSPNWYDISATTGREFLSMKLQYINGLNSHFLRQITFDVQDILLFCRHCNYLKSLSPVALQLPNSLYELEAKILNFNSINKDNIMYKIWPLSDAYVDGFFLIDEKMGDTSRRSEIENILQNHDLHLNTIRWELVVKQLGNIFYNATFVVAPFACPGSIKLSCDDFYQPFVFIVPSGQLDYTHFHLHHTCLTFVSCSTPDHWGLAFDQLFSIFDVYVWMCLCISTLAIATFSALVQMYRQLPQFKRLLGNANSTNCVSDATIASMVKIFFKDHLFQSIMCYFKVLVEQGDPINIHLWNLPFLGSTFACYLFVAVVISNAYKNENINQLTLPRASIPYDTFEVLINNKFKIFTRATVIGGYNKNIILAVPEFDGIIKTVLKTMFGSTTDQHHLSTVYRSEVFTFGQAEISMKRFFMTAENFSQSTKYLMNHSGIIPHWQELLGDSKKECSLFVPKNKCDPLRFCNKTAVFLPSTDAKRKYDQMKKEKYKNVYLGQEKLIENKYGIMFTRWVYPHILQRMKGLYASGSIEWWDRYVLSFLSKLRSEYEEETGHIASNLQGNIVVVFTLIPAGLLISLVVFLKETYRIIWRFISRLF